MLPKMNEKYLHLIWKTKRLPFHLLKTTNNEKISILNTGVYNLASGPDFFNGQIEIEDIKISGNIELHVKSSDWFLHKHQFDSTYNNVILHVVYENDRDLEINERKIPTLELKNFIDWDHFQLINTSVFSNKIPCENSFQLANEVLIWSQFEQALLERITRKVNDLDKLNTHLNNPKKVFLVSLAQTFGMKVNAFPFVELAFRLPIETWLNLPIENKIISAIGIAGLENNLSASALNEWKFTQHKFLVLEMNVQTWKFKGLRPAGFPINRIIQFALFCHFFSWDFTIFNQSANSIVETFKSIKRIPLDDYSHLFNQKIDIKINDSLIDLVLINTISPFIQLYKSYLGENYDFSNSISLLENIKQETNSITKYWEKIGVKINSAADSQSLIEQYNNKCVMKKCMNCQISSVILN